MVQKVFFFCNTNFLWVSKPFFINPTPKFWWKWLVFHSTSSDETRWPCLGERGLQVEEIILQPSCWQTSDSQSYWLCCVTSVWFSRFCEQVHIDESFCNACLLKKRTKQGQMYISRNGSLDPRDNVYWSKMLLFCSFLFAFVRNPSNQYLCPVAWLRWHLIWLGLHTQGLHIVHISFS